MISIKSFTQEGLEGLLTSYAQPKFRTKQLIQWLYQKHAHSYDEMMNLPQSLRDTLSKNNPLTWAYIDDKRVSKDGTRKYIVKYDDGMTTEMVAIPSNDRLTVCFSTQVGCAMACSFCATGQEGFSRNLLPGEILDQIMLAEHDFGIRVTNVVGMGQGEPFQNYENVLSAVRFINSKDGLNIGARHITVSSCGIIPGIKRWQMEPEQFTLAISLHSAVQKTRDILMPKVKNQSLSDLRYALNEYTQVTNRRVTLEYIMIKDFNDDSQHLNALVDFCSGLLCHVNLIPINSVDGSPYQPSLKSTTDMFLKTLQNHHIEATLRQSRGSDIDGACGQLKNKRSK